MRTFLFQLFCIEGAWDRALTQLTVAAELDPLALPMAETYRTLIRCEMLREGVFAGTRTPTLFGHPLPWVPLLVEANRALAASKFEAAAGLRDRAFEQADAVPGSVDDQPFDWFADADPRLGPVLEAIVDGTYYWIPIQNVAALAIEPPADLRDQVWMPASFTWTNGGEAIGFIPTRYPASATADDQLLAPWPPHRVGAAWAGGGRLGHRARATHVHHRRGRRRADGPAPSHLRPLRSHLNVGAQTGPSGYSPRFWTG